MKEKGYSKHILHLSKSIGMDGKVLELSLPKYESDHYTKYIKELVEKRHK